MRIVSETTGWRFGGPLYRTGHAARGQMHFRITLFQYFVVACLLVIGAGYWRVQISTYPLYAQLAEDNRVRDVPVIAPRGRILDREGRVMVGNAPSFTVMLHGASEPLSEGEVERVSRGIGVDPAELRNLSRQGVSTTMFRPKVLKRAATLADISFIESNRWEFPELDLVHYPHRAYPHGDFATHVIGHVGEASEEEVSRPGSRRRRGSLMGRSGAEIFYDDILAGKDGTRRVIVDSRGREFDPEDTVLAEAGTDVRLTLDLDLQRVAQEKLGDWEGAVVALDPRTGEVLALVSQPSFDPAVLAGHVRPEVWRRLVNDPGKPLLNRATQAHLSPGSIFKIIVATAALEEGIVSPSYRLFCKGYAVHYGNTFRDWTWKGHGWVNMHKAIKQSCDVYFYRLGKVMGIEKIAEHAKKMGLGSPTGIDLPGETSGLIPSPEWVRRRYNRRWYPGETISVAIGPGGVATTPLQLAYTIGGIASGGVFRQPHIVLRDQFSQMGYTVPELKVKRVPLKESTVEIICRGMWGVVNEDGTAKSGRIEGLDVAGKTGTAQVVSRKTREAAGEDDPRYRANAWFLELYPHRNPEIVVCVLLVGGEHSWVAVPIAREVIRAYHEKKTREEVPPDEGLGADLQANR